MNFWTMLMIRANDDAKAVTDSHINRRCVEESAETIPGFLHGETMLSTEDLSMANSCFKQLPATETDRDNAFPIGSYRAR